MLDRIEFVLSEAWVSLRRNTWMTFASVTTSAMALFLLGGIGMAYLALSSFAASLESKFEMSVFMKDAPNQEEIDKLGARLKVQPGVQKVEFKPRAQVWEEFKAKNPKIVKDMSKDIENPMPDTYVLTLSDLKAAPKIAEVAKRMPEVNTKDGVNYMQDVQEFLESTMATLRWLGFVLGGLMTLTGGILIYNTIRLTINSRRREIRIMELVGATKNMVVMPLLIEGATQGILGALLATGILFVGYNVVVRLISTFSALQDPGPFPFVPVIMILGATGLFFGMACSGLAIREPKHKEVPR